MRAGPSKEISKAGMITQQFLKSLMHSLKDIEPQSRVSYFEDEDIKKKFSSKKRV